MEREGDADAALLDEEEEEEEEEKEPPTFAMAISPAKPPSGPPLTVAALGGPPMLAPAPTEKPQDALGLCIIVIKGPEPLAMPATLPSPCC